MSKFRDKSSVQDYKEHTDTYVHTHRHTHIYIYTHTHTKICSSIIANCTLSFICLPPHFANYTVSSATYILKSFRDEEL